VGVSEGAAVTKGQAIAQLDTRSVQKNIETELNDYKKTRWDFEQIKDNYKDLILTDSIKRTLEKSQFDLNNSVLQVELLDIAKRLSTIYTPIDGIVTRVDSPLPGVNITASQAQFSVVNPKSIHFDLSVDQADVTSLAEGMRASITLDSFPESTFSGVISRISYTPKTDEVNIVYKVVVAIEDLQSTIGSKVRLGMTGDATFVLQKRENVLTLPLRAVNEDSQGSYVYISGKKDKKYIRTGLAGESTIEIVDGLQEGDIVYD
jgi:RND family efflux transporter MFP subunit